MTRHDETKAAIVALLREIEADPAKPLSLYDIGVPLVPKGYTQDELVSALYALQAEGVISLIEGNRLQVSKPL
ncbi:hypothetical protein ACC685_33360 [Rhizobium ruizarguesonis]